MTAKLKAGFTIVILFSTTLLGTENRITMEVERSEGEQFRVSYTGTTVSNRLKVRINNNTDQHLSLIPKVSKGFEVRAAFDAWDIKPRSTVHNQVFVRRAKADFSPSGKEDLILSFWERGFRVISQDIYMTGPLRDQYLGEGHVFGWNQDEISFEVERPEGLEYRLSFSGAMISNRIKVRIKNNTARSLSLVPKVTEGFSVRAAFDSWEIKPYTTVHNQVFVRKEAVHFSQTGRESLKLLFWEANKPFISADIFMTGPKREKFLK